MVTGFGRKDLMVQAARWHAENAARFLKFHRFLDPKKGVMGWWMDWEVFINSEYERAISHFNENFREVDISISWGVPDRETFGTTKFSFPDGYEAKVTMSIPGVDVAAFTIMRSGE